MRLGLVLGLGLGLAACPPGPATREPAGAAAEGGAGAPATPAAATIPSLAYTFAFADDPPRLDVRLDLAGDPSGTTRLVLPSAWAGERELYRGISGLEVTSPKGQVIVSAPEAGLRIVEHPPGAPLAVRYTLREAPEGGGLREYRPIIRAARFHFLGLAAMIRPEWPGEREVRATLEFTALPPGGALAHSFAAGARRHEETTGLGRLLQAIYVGGDFRVHARPLDAATIAVAIDGAWAFTDDAFVDLVARLVGEERRFWRDAADPYFLITLLQTGTRCCGYGGTGLSNGYATFVSTDGPIDDRLRRLIAHEMFHTWNGRKIPREAPEEAIAWFSEGFTDYYARLLALRAGVYTLDGYLAEYDDALAALYRSPLRSIDNQAIVDGFWRSPLVEKIPYHRGDALAHRLNHAIRRASGDAASLDTLMRRILALAGAGEEVSTALVRRELAALGGDALAREIDAVIVAGGLPEPPADALGPCVALEWVEMPSVALGFAPESVGEGVVRGLAAASDAHAKGVRDGQRIVELIPPRRADQRARLTLEGADEGAAEVVVMIDVEGPPVAVPRYRLRPGARADDVACTAWFADVEDGAGAAAGARP